MKVEYLRLGKGKEFVVMAQVIRRGNKIAVCRIQEQMYMATGTGTYVV
jgi:acyl-coenzyme A thioesterase PaaI-like protein